MMEMKLKYAVIMVTVLVALLLLFNALIPHKEEPVYGKSRVVSERPTVIEEIGSVISSSRLPLTEIIQEVEAEEVSSENSDIEITVYNQNLGLVKDRREIPLSVGENIVEFQGVASQIDPTSVHFKSLTAPDKCTVIEQNYEYDLVSKNKLIVKYLGKDITVEVDNKSYHGKLLSSSGGLILDLGQDGIIALANYDNIRFPRLPQGLIIKPTLVWHLLNELEGNHQVEVSYLTSGINWKANYIAIVDKDDKNIDLNGWVTIDNNCGATFPEATLKLVAGDIHRVQAAGAPTPYYEVEKRYIGVQEPQFTEETFFEYHLYSLQRKTTIKDKETKQISLFTSSGVPVTKEYVFDSSRSYWYRSQSQNKVNVMLKFANSEENGLGIPLPKGVVRVYKKDSSGQLQFIGEDSIDHTPKDESIRVYIGDAFDVTVKRTIVEHAKIGSYKWRQQIRVELNNHKDEDIEVIVKDRLYCNWEITESTHDYEKTDAWNFEFTVPVPKEGNETLEFTAVYEC